MKETVVAALLLSSAAYAAPAAPAWCKVDGHMEQGFVDAVRKGDDGPRAVVAIAYSMCNPQYVQAEDWPDIQKGYKEWSKRLGLADADWVEMAQFATTRGDLDLRPDNAKAKWSTLSGPNQYAYLMHPSIEVPGLAGETDFYYVADAFGSRLTELGRLGVVDRCLEGGRKQTPVGMAMCQADLDAFDFDKTIAEIKADTADSPATRATLRLIADRARGLIAAHKDEVKKLIAKDDAYKQMFEIAAKARKDWDAHAKENADLIAVQDAMDDAMVSSSRKALEGCHDKTWKALATAIAKLPAKSFVVKRIPDKEYDFPDDVMNRVIEIIIADPAGFLAASAYTQCEYFDPPKDNAMEDNLARWFTTLLARWSGYRGPRTAAYTAILLANLQLDDRSERIEYPDLERFWFKQGNSQSGGSTGAVESVKTKGAVATVAFGQKLVKETVDTGCTRSNHIVGIRNDGSIEYEYNCTGSKVVTYDARPNPEDVNARYANGLKAGMAVMLNTNIIWMAWPKMEASVPSYVLGVAVK